MQLHFICANQGQKRQSENKVSFLRTQEIGPLTWLKREFQIAMLPATKFTYTIILIVQ